MNNDAVYQVAINQIHKAPKTCSSVVLKMVVKDRAHCAYKGRIFIDEQGSKTEASQHHKALVLSPKASVTSEPTLEVLTHDVVCNHGSAIAYLNQEHLEYLMSRGISDQHAERLIVDSFLSGE